MLNKLCCMIILILYAATYLSYSHELRFRKRCRHVMTDKDYWKDAMDLQNKSVDNVPLLWSSILVFKKLYILLVEVTLTTSIIIAKLDKMVEFWSWSHPLYKCIINKLNHDNGSFLNLFL